MFKLKIKLKKHLKSACLNSKIRHGQLLDVALPHPKTEQKQRNQQQHHQSQPDDIYHVGCVPMWRYYKDILKNNVIVCRHVL